MRETPTRGKLDELTLLPQPPRASGPTATVRPRPVPACAASRVTSRACGAGAARRTRHSTVRWLWPDPLVAVPALAMVGMGHGFVSGLTAGAVARDWDRSLHGRVAARLYIAWCAAAISLPVLAGRNYDRTHGHGAAMTISMGVNTLGIRVTAQLARADRPRT